MLTVILLITFIAITILCLGFFEVRFPFTSITTETFHTGIQKSKSTKHDRKVMRKRIWSNQMHKGFVKIPV